VLEQIQQQKKSKADATNKIKKLQEKRRLQAQKEQEQRTIELERIK